MSKRYLIAEVEIPEEEALLRWHKELSILQGVMVEAQNNFKIWLHSSPSRTERKLEEITPDDPRYNTACIFFDPTDYVGEVSLEWFTDDKSVD